MVSIATTCGIPSDDDDDVNSMHERSMVPAQKKAGNVESYMTTVKGTMGSKKKTSGGGGRKAHKKGQHGASTVKGMGNASTFEMAKQTLSKFSNKKGGNGNENKGIGGYKGKKGKGRR